jgi:hypothetical protein
MTAEANPVRTTSRDAFGNYLEIYKCIVLTVIVLLLAGNWFKMPLKVCVVGGFMDVDVTNTVEVDGEVSIRR